MEKAAFIQLRLLSKIRAESRSLLSAVCVRTNADSITDEIPLSVRRKLNPICFFSFSPIL